MLPEAAYKAKTERVGRPKISSVEPPRQESLAGKETPTDPSILAAISRLEAGLNELRAKQSSCPPSDNSKKKKSNYRHERHKSPPAKPHEKEGQEGQNPTGDGKKKEIKVETGQKNNGIPEPIKCWGCGRIGYRRSFCQEC